MLRKKWEKDIHDRFSILKKEIVRVLESYDNELMIVNCDDGMTTNARWIFEKAADAVSRFRKWISDRVDQIVLGRTGVQDDQGNWTDDYVDTAYWKGAEQATDALTQLKPDTGPVPKPVLRGVLGGPVNLDKVRLIKERAFEKLKNITQEVSNKLGDILADGVVKGDSPRTVAREMTKQIDTIEKKRAITLARTETSRAHNEGALEAMEKMGVTEVGVDVEWTTTKLPNGQFEPRVCPQCRALEGLILPLSQAHGLLPRHPNCRCAWIPAIEDPMETKEAKKRITASIQAGMSKKAKKTKTVEQQIKDDKWIGADLV